MNKGMMKVLGSVTAPFGAVMIILSLWMMPYQEQGSAEGVISVVNLFIGGFLIISGIWISRRGRDNSRK